MTGRGTSRRDQSRPGSLGAVRPREPVLLAAGLTVLWIGIVAIIAIAAEGSEPTVAAGTVVTMLAIGLFALGIGGGFAGREFAWTKFAAIGVAGVLAIAYSLSLVVQWRWDATLYVPMIALFGGFLGWLVVSLGWLVGGVARASLGLEHDPDDGII